MDTHAKFALRLNMQTQVKDFFTGTTQIFSPVASFCFICFHSIG